MVDLADLGVLCDCGSKRLAPTGELEPGSLVICAACARPARVAVCLVPVRWSEVETELEDRPHELYAMRWHRHGVAAPKRALAELRRTGGRFTASDRAGVVLGAVLVLLLVLVVLKAVHS